MKSKLLRTSKDSTVKALKKIAELLYIETIPQPVPVLDYNQNELRQVTSKVQTDEDTTTVSSEGAKVVFTEGANSQKHLASSLETNTSTKVSHSYLQIILLLYPILVSRKDYQLKQSKLPLTPYYTHASLQQLLTTIPNGTHYSLTL